MEHVSVLRKRSSMRFVPVLQQVPGIQRFSILRPQGGPAGSDIEVGM